VAVVTASRPPVTHVVNSLDPGGTERLVIGMCRALAADFDVEVVCLDRPGEWAGELRAAGIAVHALWRQPGLDTAMPAALADRLRRHGARIVHAHQCTAWFYAALSRALHPGPRLLLEEHGRFHPEVDRPLRRLANRLLLRRLTHRFVAVSADIRERLAVYEGLPREAIEVVPNGVPAAAPVEPAVRAARRAALGLPQDAFVVGTVGRFDPIKNLPLLVDALARAAPRVPTLHALLVGDGPELGPLRQRVAEAGLADRVRFTGFRADARELTQCMDLFVLSSHSEGLSVALLDAQAAGVPAAVTAVGGNPDVVADGETGWVVAPGDADALARAIVAAAGDPQLRAALGAAAIRRHAERFDWDRMLGRYRALYLGMLGEAA
jgi:glycosyltransferase involved in cell wall biosynthesis